MRLWELDKSVSIIKEKNNLKNIIGPTINNLWKSAHSFQIAQDLVGRVQTGWIRNQFLFSLFTFLLPVAPIYKTSPNHAPLLQVKSGKFFTGMCWEHTSHFTNHMHIPTYLHDTNKAPTKTRLKRSLWLNSINPLHDFWELPPSIQQADLKFTFGQHFW